MLFMISMKRDLPPLLVVLMLVFQCLGVAQVNRVSAAAGTGQPADTNIEYTGRWDISNASTYKSYWSGAYFRVNFTGTTAKLKLASSSNIYVSIDQGKDIYYAGANGTVNMTPAPLASGTHTLRVAARSEKDVIAFQGLVLDNGATTSLPAARTKRIEFVGDSITAGCCALPKWALSDYAWLVGEALNANHTQISYSGICLLDGYRCGKNGIGMTKQFYKLGTTDYPNSADWDFSRYQASAVVINIGTNDNTHALPDRDFQSNYITFLQNIRIKYPNAEIYVLRTFLGFRATQTQAAVNARINAGDLKVHYVDTTGWVTKGTSDYSDNLHPSTSGHIKIANKLIPILSGSSPTTAILMKTGFETCDIQPTWKDTADWSSNVTGYLSTLSPEASRTNEKFRNGTSALLYSGTAKGGTNTNIYFKEFQVNIPVTGNTVLDYYLNPQVELGRFVAVDLHFTDGTTLRDSGSLEQSGYNVHPSYGHGGTIPLNNWSLISSRIGLTNAGKTIDKIWVGYDRPGRIGHFRGYIDDLSIYNVK